MSLGLSNPNGETYVDYKIDPVGANNAFGAGITSGFNVRAKSGMVVEVGGENGTQDSALVKATSGVIYPVGNNSTDSVEITIPGAPSTNSRIDSIVLSVDTTTTTSELNGSDLISLDVVSGTPASTPSVPSDSDIVSEIGAGKAYIVLANITLPAGTTDITSDMIEQGPKATIGSQNIDFVKKGSITQYASGYSGTLKYTLIDNVCTITGSITKNSGNITTNVLNIATIPNEIATSQQAVFFAPTVGTNYYKMNVNGTTMNVVALPATQTPNIFISTTFTL